MKKDIWGPYIWIFLHCFTIRIKDECFNEEKNNIIKYISQVCDNLPCPQCSIHAIEYLKKHRFKFIQTKQDLIQIIFNLHNDVNKRTKKPEFDFSKLHETYSKYHFQKLIIAYINFINNVNYGEKMMIYSMRRSESMKHLLNYFKENIEKYDIIV